MQLLKLVSSFLKTWQYMTQNASLNYSDPKTCDTSSGSAKVSPIIVVGAFPLLQGSSEQRPHKVSYSVSLQGEEAKRGVERLRESLQAEGLAAKVIYSGGEDLDVLPAHASKGKGLEFLLSEASVNCHSDSNTLLMVFMISNCFRVQPP